MWKGNVKKIIFLLLTFAVGFYKNVQALDRSRVSFRSTAYMICDDQNNAYPTYFIQYGFRDAFFLNVAKEYNTNWDDYHLISFEESPFPEEIQYLTPSNIYFSDSDYRRWAHRLLWEKLYPEMTFKYCIKNLESELNYQKYKEKIYDIYDGPEFIKKTVYQNPGELYEYTDEYLSFFEIDASEELQAFIENNSLKVVGDKGAHQLILKRREPTPAYTNNLYTDGTNYLLHYPSTRAKEYILNVVVGQKNLKLAISDERLKKLSDVCIKVNEEQYCSNEEGLINYQTFEESINIEMEGNLDYEDLAKEITINNQETIQITLKDRIIANEDQEVKIDETPLEKEEPIIDEPIIEKNEIVVVNPDDVEEEKQVIIEVKDTLVGSVVIIFLLGLGFALLKKI